MKNWKDNNEDYVKECEEMLCNLYEALEETV